ncbi:F5/8_type C domain-containing protein [Hexamita inflata]|uniref:F5/8 type C domain-containing protein n=1 Tax=Hexamita inflata TaxID=28002 RepID=A0AA86R6P7_9EUKA|nr:F5/8 type C domain-containing protein [Hexamita inflata]
MQAQEDQITITQDGKESTQKIFQLSNNLKHVTRTVSDYYCDDNVNIDENFNEYNVNDQLNGACQSYLDGRSWQPQDIMQINGQYLEFNFNKKVLVGQIITIGNGQGSLAWVTKYKVEYYLEDKQYDGGNFDGNSDGNTKAIRNTCFIADKLSIYPLEFHYSIALRAEVAITEDVSQANIGLANQAVEAQAMQGIDINELRIKAKSKAYDLKLKYSKLVKQYRIVIQNPSKDANEQIQFYNFIFYENLDNKLIIYTRNDQRFPNIESETKLEVIHEPFRFLQIKDDKEVTDLNFLNEEELLRVLIYKCPNVNFTQPISIVQLFASQCNIENLEGIQNWMQLQDLNLLFNNLKNIDQLKTLTNLTQLALQHNQITNIEPLAKLCNLQKLNVSENKIENLEPLMDLVNLVDLRLFENKISDISVLSKLKNLIVLNLRNNKISKIDVLESLTSITELRLQANLIQDISPISNLKNMSKLFLTSNQISNIESLADLTLLFDLDLSSNAIKDFSVLEKHQNRDKFKLDAQK